MGERELETEHNCNILNPSIMAVSFVSFLFSWCSNRRPRGPALCWMMAFFTGWWLSLSASSLDPKSQGPQAPSAWCGFPYHNSSISPSPTVTGTVLTSVLTELYNSSTSTQSPTRSSGNNCHAVHRSLSSGASVYECTQGIFLPRPNFRARDFLS